MAAPNVKAFFEIDVKQIYTDLLGPVGAKGISCKLCGKLLDQNNTSVIMVLTTPPSHEAKPPTMDLAINTERCISCNKIALAAINAAQKQKEGEALLLRNGYTPSGMQPGGALTFEKNL